MYDFAQDSSSQSSIEEDQEEITMSNNNVTNPLLGPSRGDKILDYSNAKGIKTYKRATAALKDEYDGLSEGIVVFQMQWVDQAESEGRENKKNGNIINIPKDGNDENNGVINLIKQYKKKRWQTGQETTWWRAKLTK